ncbi:MAG: glycosyltransferase family 39 protein [Candidatus Alcyoniella australis]|nr:glycosyltransferase family 39 protein [Candidatus Alcyoniella australis]
MIANGPTTLRRLKSGFDNSRGTLVGVLLIVVVGAVLRLYKLGYQSLWTDEALTIYVSQSRLMSLLQFQLHDASPPLYYLVIGGWTMFIESDYWIRIFAALFGIAVLPFIYFLGRELFGRRVGMLSTALFALWPLHVYYSQENRYQSLFVLLVVLSSLAYLRMMVSLRLSSWAVYIAASALGMYTHYYMPMVIFGQTMATLLYFRSRRAWLLQGLALLAIALAFLPQLPLFMLQAGFEQQRETFPLIQRLIILLGFIVFGGSEWSMATLPYVNLDPGVKSYTAAAFVLGAPLLLSIALGAWRDFRHPRHRGLIAVMVLLPIVILLLLASFKQVFRPKYFLCWMPFFAILAAGGLSLLWHRSRPAASLLATAVIALLLGSTLNIYDGPNYRREAWRHAAFEISEQAQRGRDCVVVLNRYSSIAFFHYFDGEVPVIPILGNFTEPANIPQKVVQQRLEKLSQYFERMWLVLYQEQIWDPERAVRNTAEQMFQQVEIKNIPHDPRFDVAVYSLERDRQGAGLSSCVDFIDDAFSREQLLDGWLREIENQRWIGRSAEVKLKHHQREPFVQSIFYFYAPYFQDRTTQACLTVEGRDVNCRDLDQTANYWIHGVIPNDLLDRDVLRVGLRFSEGFIPDEVLHDGYTEELTVLVQRICIQDADERVSQ